MRLLGFGSLALLVLSFICWFSGWAYVTFFLSPATYGGSLMPAVIRGVNFTASILQYLAVLLLAVGLIIAGASKKASM